MDTSSNKFDSAKQKTSNDTISQLIGLFILVALAAYYVATKEWARTSIWGFVAVIVLVALQQTLLHIKGLKDKPYIASGGIFPLILYSATTTIAFIYYLPLYSPFIVVILVIMFINIYFKGLYSLLFSYFVLVEIVVFSTLHNGLPHLPYAKYYPYLAIYLGFNFGLLVYRAGSINERIRSDLIKATGILNKEAEQLNSLMNGIKDSVIATDENGNIVFSNSASLKLFNLGNIDSGIAFSKLIKLYDDRSNPVEFFSLFIPELEKQSINNLHIIDNSNQVIYLSIEVAKIKSIESVNKFQGVIMLFRDITKEKSLDDERDEFVSVTSHELRTPIAIAEANLSLAMDKRITAGLDSSIKDRLKQAHDGIMNLADLVNQLTELSDVERKNLEVENQVINPNEIIEYLKKEYDDKAAEKGLTINIEKSSSTDQIFTSKIYLQEIIENFLTNAIKYTDKGTVTLKTEATPRNSVVFSVSDTGNGISNSDKDKIFTKFYRAEDYKRKHTRGTGLGLYLTQRIAKTINGKIWFSSELSKGSTFYFEINSLPQKVEAAENSPEELQAVA